MANQQKPKPKPKLLQTRVKSTTARYVATQAKAEGVSVATWLRQHFDALATLGSSREAPQGFVDIAVCQAKIEQVGAELRALRLALGQGNEASAHGG